MTWLLIAAAGLFPVAVTVWVAWRSLSPPRQGPPDSALLSLQGAETVSIPSSSSGRTLHGYCVEASGEDLKGVVVLIHGWGSSGGDMLSWSTFLAQAGWASLAVDLRGHGACQAEPRVTLPDLAQDIQVVWEWMETQASWAGLPHMLLGHSMGGAASLYATANLGVQPGALVLSGAFARVEVITEYVLKKWKIPAFPFHHLVKWVWKLRTGIDLKAVEPEAVVGQVRVPILATHGALDPVVPAGEMQRLLSRAPMGTESVEIPGAGHSDLVEYQEYRKAIVSFLNRSVYSIGTR